MCQEHGPNIQLGPLYPTSLHIEAGQPGEIGTAPLLDASAKFTNGEPDDYCCWGSGLVAASSKDPKQ